MASKGKRALLVLDNFSGHTKLDEDPAWTPLLATELLFLPPGTTSVTQPLDQALKCLYKSKMHQEFKPWKLKRVSICRVQSAIFLLWMLFGPPVMPGMK
ncbi:hypothetical protein Ciccas_007697 [Cichlidogyrus casuarinus]|uniref:DDE-1 domain-containing protein n=1 Tax=Cichlidogyrus casuarinus TaxID=1844966 RepID=A0ABD2Q258_9PLAT